jgi:hypothetical protein
LVRVKLFFDDQDFDGQLLRAVGYTAYGGADIGECVETAGRIKVGDRSSWYEAWTKTADRMKADAQENPDPGQFDEFDLAMARMPQEIREAIEQDDPKVDSFLEKMVQDDARRFFLAARMRAFGTKTIKELVLMQREYSLKGLAEKIECPTLVCDNVGDAVAGGRGRNSTRRCGVPRTTCCSPRRRGRRPLRGRSAGHLPPRSLRLAG